MEEKIVEVNNENPFARLCNVNKIYDGNVHAVHDFNLDINKHEFIVFVGPSGCGKSTTLRMIAGLENITSGELYIGGVLSNDVLCKERDIAMVFQSYALYPNMDVFDNMAFSLQIKHLPKDEIKQRVEEAAEILELTDYLHRKPKNLSGGQRQRVALGRAIVRNARLFLMDEPLSNLDAKLRVQMRSEIIKIHKRIGATTIYVTHDQTEAMTMADRIVVMKDGYVQQIGEPDEIYNVPANKFVASFIGAPAMNFISCLYDEGILKFNNGFSLQLKPDSISKHDKFYKNLLETTLEELEKVKAEPEPQPQKKRLFFKKKNKETFVSKEERIDQLNNEIERIQAVIKNKKHNVTFGVRSEGISRPTKKNAETVSPKVNFSELLGDECYIHFDFCDQEFLAKIPSNKRVKEGETIDINFDLDKIHIFDEINDKTIF